MPNASYSPLPILLAATLATTLAPTASALAQNVIVPDSTLGPESSQVNSLNSTTDLIEGGAIREANLFHSFQEFNVGEGLQVYFNNPAGTDNIFSRVTGRNPSDIFGTLGVQGPANLFFINPNGIVFGPSASLDVEGSFLATTADGIRFENGNTFGVQTSNGGDVLSVNVPLGLQYGNNNPNGNNSSATIENTGSLAAGQDLTLAAGNLDLQGRVQASENLTLQATDTVKIRDTAETPFIAAAGEQLTVQGDESVDIFALNHPQSGLFSGGDMTLRSANPVGGDAHYWSGGSFRTETLNSNIGDLFSPYDPIIRSLGNVEIGDYVGSSLHILAGGSITIDSADIQGVETGSVGSDFLQETIQLSDGTLLAIDGAARPTLDLRAGVSSSAVGTSPLPAITGFDPLTEILTDSALNTNEIVRADITIGTALLFSPNSLLLLTNQYEPNPQLTEGNISIVGGEAPRIPSIKGIISFSLGEETNDIFIDSRNDISVIDSLISTIAIGNAGPVSLLAEDTVRLENSVSLGRNATGLVSSTISEQGIVGNSSGGVRITARNLELLNGAQISTTVVNGRDFLGIDLGETSEINGVAGDISINVSEKVKFEGVFTIDSDLVAGIVDEGENFPGGIFSRIQPRTQGTAGNIQIVANDLEVSNSAQIRTVVDGVGKAGDIDIDVTETAVFDGFNVVGEEPIPSAAVSNVQPDSSGTGGDIRIRANNLRITNGAELDATSSGNNDAGKITLEVNELLRLDNGTITTEALAASGGTIFVEAGSVRLSQDSDISTFVAQGEGGGGNITVAADSISAFDDSDILAFARDGIGGNVTLDTPAFFGENYQPAPAGIDPLTLDGNGRVDVNADGAIAGDIDIPDVGFIQDNLTELPDNIIETDQLIAGSCIARRSRSGSFIVSGGSGVSDRPGESAIATYPLNAITPLTETITQQTNSNPWPANQPADQTADQTIVEPQGIFQLADGRLVMGRTC
ncbi:MAG: filamentous hemagglutinin N-terminal domain-containing protein [Cyanobacteria bacterium J06598_1]